VQFLWRSSEHPSQQSRTLRQVGSPSALPPVAVIGMRDGLVDREHIDWHRATVLAQVGLLDPAGLPATGVEKVHALAPNAAAELFNALI
jgi:hypothetical protein